MSKTESLRTLIRMHILTVRLIGVLFISKKRRYIKMEDLLFEYKRALKNTKKLYKPYQDEQGLTAEQLNDKN